MSIIYLVTIIVGKKTQFNQIFRKHRMDLLYPKIFGNLIIIISHGLSNLSAAYNNLYRFTDAEEEQK